MRAYLGGLFACLPGLLAAQFTFNYGNNGQRVCLVQATADTLLPAIRIELLDSAQNTNGTTTIRRRPLLGGGNDWITVASGLAPGTGHWIDNTVSLGEVWEYQVRRSVNGQPDAIGYTPGALLVDRSLPQGRLLLLVADDVPVQLPAAYAQLLADLRADGWTVEELLAPRAAGWDSGDTVIAVRQQVIDAYNAAPVNDKPTHLFILGHVPLPRAGRDGTPPDEHAENIGARGADTYYADIDGLYTDTGTFDPGTLVTPLAVNLPGDHRLDQDALASDLELAFGRVDFADLYAGLGNEMALLEAYLEKSHLYRTVAPGWYMGNRSAYHFGYDNSNDGSFRSLVPVCGADSVKEDPTFGPHPQWVQSNGPFMCYMQNVSVPDVSEWDTYGMDATLYSSDQSYWGFGDVPQTGAYSLIRELVASNTKCLGVLWTTMAINMFHQIGAGTTLGQAFEQIMEHDAVDQKLEKPEQLYDTPDFWNRTQFAYYGDPSIRLHQVMPPTNVVVSGSPGNVFIAWDPSPDPRSPRYHVYRSATANGPFVRITSAPLTATAFTDAGGSPSDQYIVRAVVIQRTGSGLFLNPSLGAYGTSSASTASIEGPGQWRFFPNPCERFAHVTAPSSTLSMPYQVHDALGRAVLEGTFTGTRLLDLSALQPGAYVFRSTSSGDAVLRFVKR